MLIWPTMHISVRNMALSSDLYKYNQDVLILCISANRSGLFLNCLSCVQIFRCTNFLGGCTGLTCSQTDISRVDRKTVASQMVVFPNT